jgi:endonuclease-8
MPEGDTIHKLAAALAAELTGAHVHAVHLRRQADPQLAGRHVLDVTSRGKHLLIRFDNGLVLRSHLGLYGAWHRYAPGEPWRKPAHQASIVLSTGAGNYVCFNAREAELARGASYRLNDKLGWLGPDLTREKPDGEALSTRVRALLAPETALVDVLLDQRVASGIGNVYKCEILFLARQPPLQSLTDTPEEELASLYVLAGDLLRRNLGGGPRVTRFVGDGRGHLWVYGRSDRPCFVCGTSVRRDSLGANPRSTYWCPCCQE